MLNPKRKTQRRMLKKNVVRRQAKLRVVFKSRWKKEETKKWKETNKSKSRGIHLANTSKLMLRNVIVRYKPA